MATWHTIESARDQWVDAPLDDEQLTELLAVAKEAVLAYAPALGEPAPAGPVWVQDEDGYLQEVEPGLQVIPDAYRLAQLMQSRNVWNSSQVSPAGEFDTSSYGLSTFPLDWQIKQILRPRSVFGGPVG